MNSSAEGLAVITLNIRKLLFVYYMWTHENIDKYKKDADSVLLGLHHLMKMIILPNMLITQIDMVVMNRFMNYYYGSPMSKPFNRLPFTVKDLTHRLDKSLFHILDILGNLTYTYPSLLKSIPAITMTNMYDYLMMPDIPLTRQINWSYAVARSSIFKFIIELGGVKDIKMNKNLIVNARININLLETEHVLKTRLPTDIYGDVSEDLDYIKKSINTT